MLLNLCFTRLALYERGAKTVFGRLGFTRAKLAAVGRGRPGVGFVRLALLVGFSLLTVPSDAAPKYSGWSSPVNLGPVVNSEYNDTLPVISANGLSLYFSSNRPGPIEGPPHFDIWVSQRASVNDAWGTPVNLGANINTAGYQDAPALSRDGHWLFFTSDQIGGQGGLDLWVSWRADTNDDFGWLPAVNLGGTINTSALEGGSSSPFGNTLYFISNRPGGTGFIDIYVSHLTSRGSYGPATLVTELSSPSQDLRPFIRHDGLEIVLDSNRAGSTAGSRDLWVSTRQNVHAAWPTPMNLGPIVNSEAFDGFPSLSPDGQALFFSSNRPGGSGGVDIWMSARQKIAEP